MVPQIKRLNWRTHHRDVLEFQREIYETNFPGFVVSKRFLRDYASQLRRSLNDPHQPWTDAQPMLLFTSNLACVASTAVYFIEH